MAERIEVCPAAELPPGERRVIEAGGLSIGVFNVGGEYHALLNLCPHQLAPLCEGRVTGTTTADAPGEYDWERDGQIVRCPWHGWEFDVATGESVFNPHVGTRTFETAVEQSEADAADSQEATDGEDSTHDGDDSPRGDPDPEVEAYGTALAGEAPPVDTYDVEVDEGTVVVYV
jgi:nitrite reductase/ring-hydroxylating ferredoxin subunit